MIKAVTPKIAALGTFAVALLPALAAAETLEQAWQLALEHDYTLAAATADLETARSNENAARAARWPALSAAAAYTSFATAPQFAFAVPGFSVQAPIVDGDDYTSGSIQVTLPLFTGGRISKGIDAAHQAALGALDAQGATRAMLRLEVAEAFIGVLRAERLRLTAESSVASLTAHAGDAQRMVERELVPRSDLLAARVALANAEQQRVRATNGLAVAYASYNRRLGQPLDRTADLEDASIPRPEASAQPLQTLIDRALRTRAEIGALTAQADALALQSESQRAELLPQLALVGGYNYLDTEILDRKDFTSIGIGLTWNLFDGGQVRNRSAALRSASRAARHRLEDLRTQVEFQVRQAWLGLQEAQARVAASRDAVAQSNENLRTTRELYGAGLGTNTQVLDAVTLQVTAANNLDNAVLDESLAHLRLARAAGDL